jgi:aminoglycoside phosphotransferase (APT) family kinase protein
MSLKAPLERFLAGACGGVVSVERFWPIPGGASRETWGVEARIVGGPHAGDYRLVLRLDMQSKLAPDALSREQEFQLLALAHAGGVRCPRPRWYSADPAQLGAPFLLMDWVEGESIGPRVVRRPDLADARQRLPQQMAEQLALIHSLNEGQLTFLPRPADGANPAGEQLALLGRMLREMGGHSAGLTAILRWLELNQPPSEQLCLLHGDFRIGNLIVSENGLAGVIDWEFAHIGDPLEDLAWPLVRDWRFGNDGLRLGGIAEAESYLALYGQLSGRSVDPGVIYYWEILGNVKWAVSCLVQAERHLSGRDPSVELASLGRRSAEMEHEALRLIAALG